MLNRGAVVRHSQQNRFLIKSLLCGLIFSMTLSALGIVYVRFSTRELFNEWHQLQAQRDEMNLEWTQWMLERSTLSAQSRVDRIAQQSLEMRPPQMDETVWVTQ